MYVKNFNNVYVQSITLEHIINALNSQKYKLIRFMITKIRNILTLPLKITGPMEIGHI